MGRTKNPYDRREADRAYHGIMTADLADGANWSAESSTGGQYLEAKRGRAFSMVHFGDIEAMVESAYSRGFEDRHMSLMEKHDRELHTARRMAWDEGYSRGEQDEALILFSRMDKDFGRAIGEMREAIANEVVNEKATKERLRRLLENARHLFDILVMAHHDGFLTEDDEHRIAVNEILTNLEEFSS